jgi:hypothetical protein
MIEEKEKRFTEDVENEPREEKYNPLRGLLS